MKHNKEMLFKQCMQLLWMSFCLSVVILNLMPMTDTNNLGESCVYVPHYNTVYQWFLNNQPCVFTTQTYVMSYIVLLVLYGLFYFIFKAFKYFYQKIFNKPLTVQIGNDSTFKLWLIQTILLTLGYWGYLVYMTTTQTTLSLSVLFLTLLGTILYIIQLMLVIGCFRLLKKL